MTINRSPLKGFFMNRKAHNFQIVLGIALALDFSHVNFALKVT